MVTNQAIPIQKSRYVSNRYDGVSVNKHFTWVLFKKYSSTQKYIL